MFTLVIAAGQLKFKILWDDLCWSQKINWISWDLPIPCQEKKKSLYLKYLILRASIKCLHNSSLNTYEIIGAVLVVVTAISYKNHS